MKRPERAFKFLFLGIQSKKLVKEGVWYKESRIDKKKLEGIVRNAAEKFGISSREVCCTFDPSNIGQQVCYGY
jgi:hypothetical protein